MIDWRYFAGLFDGEGTVYARQTVNGRGNPRFTYGVSMSNTDPRPLLMLEENFGGKARLRSGVSLRPCFEWYCSHSQSALFARSIVEFSIIKKDQLELMIAFSELMRRGRSRDEPLVEEDFTQRSALIEEISEAKKIAWEISRG